ncbi:hypothetical protein AVEN_69272-1 [Araneus ventricosus]|uniref:Uncharacterized protein n=1 Tax=Araneus ventricosus TaxID=182803 RepID=A0A4Y2JZD1_ARAVE|nr:hypothetical protein AVEN_69272-1 [Araneus ventricosus]
MTATVIAGILRPSPSSHYRPRPLRRSNVLSWEKDSRHPQLLCSHPGVRIRLLTRRLLIYVGSWCPQVGVGPGVESNNAHVTKLEVLISGESSHFLLLLQHRDKVNHMDRTLIFYSFLPEGFYQDWDEVIKMTVDLFLNSKTMALTLLIGNRLGMFPI